jgi:hypothetical protein
VNLFWAIERNMTAPPHIESLHRFKPLLLAAISGARICQGEVDFAGTRFESFPLRELRHDVSLRTFAAPTALQTSAV